VGPRLPLNIVWLKRDLRLTDHAPLLAAEQAGDDYLIIYLYEPSLLKAPDSDLRHQRFVYQSLVEMDDALLRFNKGVEVFHGEAVAVFQYLIETYTIGNIYSHEESGTRLTWERDKAVGKLLKENEIKWTEYQRDGVIRGIKSRKDWDKQWKEVIAAPLHANTYYKVPHVYQKIDHPFALQRDLEDQLKEKNKLMQHGGMSRGQEYLANFMEGRVKNYASSISKPLKSRTSCSRISPYLAWGNLSLRQAYRFVSLHDNKSKYKRSTEGFLTRLHWHCHFIQKFEVECEYETHCINRGYESLGYGNDQSLITAWETGMTGLPLVDACMRCLHATGWVNFRMRAMLVSVFCHHLDCDWRLGVYHLARLFLDYEPGIHYPQWQMQAGTTGVNTIRMYNPIKQSYDHDPDGLFIKEWVPELRDVPLQFLHEPWKMTALDRQFNSLNIDYPHPVIHIEQAARSAREKLWGHRDNPLVIKENKRILQTHVRPNSRKRRSTKSRLKSSTKSSTTEVTDATPNPNLLNF